MERGALLSSIRQLQERKERLLHEMEEVERQLAVQNAKYTQIVNDDAPVSRLPDEVLADIFLFCKKTSIYPRRGLITPFQVLISHVSHRWRTLAFSTPLLWNNIYFHIRRHNIQRILAQLDAQLLHSGNCFLDIAIDAKDVDVTPFLGRLARHVSRWRRFSFISNHPDVEQFRTLLLHADPPMLEHLSLALGNPRTEAESGSPRRPYPSLEWTILTPAPPRLSFVRLAGHAVGHLHPPLGAVTTLHLDGWSRHYITPDQLTSVFASTPALAHLSLNQVFMHHSRDPSATPRAVALPHLQQLRIRGPCSAPARFFALFDAPRLAALSLQHLDALDTGALPALRRVSIDACALAEMELAAFMRGAPAVEELSIDDSQPDVFELLLPGGDNAGLWPALHTLAVRSLTIADLPHLCHLVFMLQGTTVPDGRTAGERRLRKVSLDRRSRTILRTRHRLDWLGEQVAVEVLCDEPWPTGLGYHDPHDMIE